MSKYFNINMIDDYLELGLKFKVFVDGEYLIVNDPWDLINNHKAIGYTRKGEPIEFEYMDVDHVMIGSNVFTKDQLNGIDKKQGDEEGGQAGSEETEGGEEAPEQGGPAEPKEEPSGAEGEEADTKTEEQPEEEAPE